MPVFSAYDGTQLAYHEKGDGAPLLCVPGGPMRASVYLGDLGGLTAHRRLILLDLRGTGDSAAPDDTSTYRCDRQTDDVEALREHLGLDQVDVLGHSAGGDLATLYAARHPKRIRTLILVTPATLAVGGVVTDEDRREAAELRKDEPWYPAAEVALREIAQGRTPTSGWDVIGPLLYGRWDAEAQTHRAQSTAQKNLAASEAYYGEAFFDPPATRAALTAMTAPVLVLAGAYDGGPSPARAEELAALFPGGVCQVQPGGGHFPWLDDPEWFTRRVAGFLAQH
ncbi:alpha/beta hydrolase [Streptomyces sp. WAC 01529]|uniref:alpha/beta fold hydrolase n=1 Tax=Streptomyces sp. WAC 01529 TaxID=2203205 RepID=UPI000F70EECF|nr:alpha/beta hydrolase [Streptomyces sp. WAC 01529]AZM58120.1 alpha/beta hydrolase [Streptomyces sp. WAC 01529]